MELERDRSIIEKIFESSAVFEKEILHVSSDNGRSEIMHILTTYLVRDILKEHINFLYIKDLKDFTLKQIVNIIFKEIASEWVSYAIETLDYTKKEALRELQPRDRVRLIHSLAVSYYQKYKFYIFEEIADTFIELVASITKIGDKSVLVDSIINSLIQNKTVLGINDFNQLYKKVKSAKSSKNKELSDIQIKLSDILDEINNLDIRDEKREELLVIEMKYEKKEKEISAMKLDKFDGALQRVKKSIINSLSSEKYDTAR